VIDVEDLTHLLPGGPLTALTPTSQAAGNQRHDNSLGMTAPGSVPASPTNGVPGAVDVHGPPEISADAYERPVLIGPDGASVSADRADRDNPNDDAPVSGWRDSDSHSLMPQTRARPGIRMGQWNNI
jgi:hypothetical protein